MDSIKDFLVAKTEKKKITMVSAYDYTAGMLLAQSDVDCILVGDSGVMMMAGEKTTLPATTELMVQFTRWVSRGVQAAGVPKWIVGDFPFLACRKGVNEALECAGRLMTAGAHSVKIEGVLGHEEVISHLIQSGIPVMGHIGLTPQSVFQLGGFKVQGREEKMALDLIEQAKKLQSLGCYALVLECVPTPLAQEITQALSIPTLGIGAGAVTDGQVLVWHDLLGLNQGFKPKFVRTYLEGVGLVKSSLNRYVQETRDGSFPSQKESFEK